jgi:type I restriction enzyme S subunit
MRKDWTECCFEDLLDYEQPTKYIVKSTNYHNSYETPVLTAGKTFVKGYTNETDGIFENLPTIIFDDFTTATQYVNFKFKVKSSAMKILVPTSKLINMSLVYYAMQVNQVRSDTHKRYWISVFAKKKFLLPPSVEQKAIFRKIEELFSSLDSGIADLKKAQGQLAIYRQAVLKKAFEGELTKEWREKQTNLPTADILLEQIKEERQKHYEKQLSDWKEAVKLWEENESGKKPSKPKKLINYTEIEQSGFLPILNLGDLVFQISNKKMPNEAPEMPFIGMDCLRKNALKPHFTYKFKEFKSAGNWFNTNHVLYGRLRPYLNKVYQAEYEGVASGEFLILETIKSLKPNYLKLILHQQDFVHWSNNQSAGDKPRVKYEQIALYAIRVPTIKEQEQIVKVIESRLSVCDNVEESIKESLQKAQALRQSILKKAFDGKLLSVEEIKKCKQHKEYEPASVLLEKIKKEKLRKKK